MKYSEDMEAYLSEVKRKPESTSCIVVRSSAFTSEKSGLLDEETLSLFGSPKGGHGGVRFVEYGGVDVESSSAALSVHSFEFLVLGVYVGVSNRI